MSSAVNDFLWVILPYVALTVFVVGHVWRYRTDQFGWTSRSSQLYERKVLAVGGPLFHYGVLAAVAGHVLGILVPKSWTVAVGLNEHRYHLLAAIGGTFAGAAATAGMLILIYRRLAYPRVRRATSATDVAMYVTMGVVVALGIGETVAVNVIGHGYDYRGTVGLWFRSIFAGHPDVGLMVGAPLVYQVHALTAWAFLALFPFTRLVHAWSAPVWYLWRPFVLYRRRTPARPREAGASRRWRRVGVEA